MKLIQKSFPFAFLILLLFAFSSNPVNDDLNRIVKTLTAYTHFRPQEKLYLHLDKPLYAAGENIWFKAYLVSASFHMPDSSSRLIYVELLNNEKKLVYREILYAPNGMAHGDFTLGDSLREGKYVVRAYTNYMKNTGEDFFFLKEIDILNLSSSKKTITTVTRPTVALQFLPEGGNFLTGAENRLAFKAINEQGEGIVAEGEVIDENNEVITSFKTEYNGMGMVKITPAHPQKNYKARLKTPAGVEGFFPLPEVAAKGYLLRINEESENLRVIIYTNVKSFSAERCLVYLVAQSRGVVTYAVQAEIVNTSLVTKIPKNLFPTGIAQITLFDASSTPQCERLVFIDHQDQLQCSITTNKPTYTKRTKVELDIAAINKEGAPVSGNFSLSVYDESKIKAFEKYPLNIANYLLLTSDLTGNIGEPGYYLKDKTPDTKFHLDLLMMTHGWRRFSWHTVLQDTVWAWPHYTEKGIVVSGKVLRSLINKPAAGGKVKILTKNGDLVVLTADSLGRFFSDHLLYYDSLELVIQTDNAKGKQTELQLKLDSFNPSPAMQYTPSAFKTFDANDFITQANRQNRIMDALDGTAVTLKAIEITSTKIEEQRSTIYGTPDQTIKMDRYMQNSSSILQALQGRVAGLIISGSPPDMTARFRGGTPLFLVDGMQLDIESVASLSPSDIEFVDVIKGAGAAVYGSQGGNGVIAIYTRNGIKNVGIISGIHQLKYPGFYKAREFYSPRYDIVSEKHDLPDIRNVLYWNPQIKTDSTGKAHVSFYTSDINSAYKIILEGISTDGVPGVGSYQFKTN